MNVALLGCGTVGGGVLAIIDTRIDDVEVTRILTLPGELDDPRVTNDISDIVNDASIDCVVEAMGGIEPAHTFIMQCLAAGKSVVTANKAVVAAYFAEFTTTAEENGVGFFIEATSGGGIPWIASIIKARRIDEIELISGIMNGTSNFIINKMETEGAEFADVLKLAQDMGYAEADPSADIDGIDTANKAIISSTVAFDSACQKQVPMSGIRNLTKADIDAFARLGLRVRLMMRAHQAEWGYAVAVEPVLLPDESLEAHVPTNFNIATLVGTTVGPLKFYGQGAGGYPTGNAIVQDILDCKAGVRHRYPTDSVLTWTPTLLEAPYCVRTSAELSGEVLADYGDGRALVSLGSLTPDDAHKRFMDILEDDPDALLVSRPEPTTLGIEAV